MKPGDVVKDGAYYVRASFVFRQLDISAQQVINGILHKLAQAETDPKRKPYRHELITSDIVAHPDFKTLPAVLQNRLRITLYPSVVYAIIKDTLESKGAYGSLSQMEKQALFDMYHCGDLACLQEIVKIENFGYYLPMEVGDIFLENVKDYKSAAENLAVRHILSPFLKEIDALELPADKITPSDLVAKIKEQMDAFLSSDDMKPLTSANVSPQEFKDACSAIIKRGGETGILKFYKNYRYFANTFDTIKNSYSEKSKVAKWRYEGLPFTEEEYTKIYDELAWIKGLVQNKESGKIRPWLVKDAAAKKFVLADANRYGSGELSWFKYIGITQNHIKNLIQAYCLYMVDKHTSIDFWFNGFGYRHEGGVWRRRNAATGRFDKVKSETPVMANYHGYGVLGRYGNNKFMTSVPAGVQISANIVDNSEKGRIGYGGGEGDIVLAGVPTLQTPRKVENLTSYVPVGQTILNRTRAHDKQSVALALYEIIRPVALGLGRIEDSIAIGEKYGLKLSSSIYVSSEKRRKGANRTGESSREKFIKYFVNQYGNLDTRRAFKESGEHILAALTKIKKGISGSKSGKYEDKDGLLARVDRWSLGQNGIYDEKAIATLRSRAADRYVDFVMSGRRSLYDENGNILKGETCNIIPKKGTIARGLDISEIVEANPNTVIANGCNGMQNDSKGMLFSNTGVYVIDSLMVKLRGSERISDLSVVGAQPMIVISQDFFKSVEDILSRPDGYDGRVIEPIIERIATIEASSSQMERIRENLNDGWGENERKWSTATAGGVRYSSEDEDIPGHLQLSICRQYSIGKNDALPYNWEFAYIPIDENFSENLFKEVFFHGYSPAKFCPKGDNDKLGHHHTSCVTGFNRVICLDIDNDEAKVENGQVVNQITIGDVKEVLEERGVMAYFVPSKSHNKAKKTQSGVEKPACERFRVIIQTKEGAFEKDGEQMKIKGVRYGELESGTHKSELMGEFMYQFLKDLSKNSKGIDFVKNCDRSAFNDASRFFYGTSNNITAGGNCQTAKEEFEKLYNTVHSAFTHTNPQKCRVVDVVSYSELAVNNFLNGTCENKIEKAEKSEHVEINKSENFKKSDELIARLILKGRKLFGAEGEKLMHDKTMEIAYKYPFYAKYALYEKSGGEFEYDVEVAKIIDSVIEGEILDTKSAPVMDGDALRFVCDEIEDEIIKLHGKSYLEKLDNKNIYNSSYQNIIRQLWDNLFSGGSEAFKNLNANSIVELDRYFMANLNGKYVSNAMRYKNFCESVRYIVRKCSKFTIPESFENPKAYMVMNQILGYSNANCNFSPINTGIADKRNLPASDKTMGLIGYKFQDETKELGCSKQQNLLICENGFWDGSSAIALDEMLPLKQQRLSKVEGGKVLKSAKENTVIIGTFGKPDMRKFKEQVEKILEISYNCAKTDPEYGIRRVFLGFDRDEVKAENIELGEKGAGEEMTQEVFKIIGGFFERKFHEAFGVSLSHIRAQLGQKDANLAMNIYANAKLKEYEDALATAPKAARDGIEKFMNICRYFREAGCGVLEVGTVARSILKGDKSADEVKDFNEELMLVASEVGVKKNEIEILVAEELYSARKL